MLELKNKMIKIDKNKCIGCGTCVSICPKVFEMDIDCKAKVKSQKDILCVDEAIKSCFSNAIIKNIEVKGGIEN